MRRFVLFLALLFLPVHAGAAPGPLVLAAASLQEAMTEAADRWAREGHDRPVLSFAASSARARQILAGAPADMFISADREWMDQVMLAGLVRPLTRTAQIANRLVLIAPAGAGPATLAIRPGFPLARALGNGRLAMGDPDAVPAGRYGKAALTRLGVWPSVAGRIARGDSVRAALALVERGEAPLGIVYATDAQATKGVRVVGVFPASTHPPIVYPMAILATSRHADTAGFRRFLLSDRGRAIFARHGFLRP